MEALTYAKALMYEEDLDPSEFKKWQPRQLMLRMLEVDPSMDRPVRLEVDISGNGSSAPLYKEFASDIPISLKHLKHNYDALGSFLHAPTMRSLEQKGWHSHDRLRERCETLVGTLRGAVESEWTLRFSNTIKFDCEKCGRPVRRHLDRSVERREITCWHCNASYLISHSNEQQVERTPKAKLIPCANGECGQKITAWHNDIMYGSTFVCEACGSKTTITYAAVLAQD